MEVKYPELNGYDKVNVFCRLLVGHLFKKKEPQQEGDPHPFEDTLRRLLDKLALFHTIARASQEVPHPPLNQNSLSRYQSLTAGAVRGLLQTANAESPVPVHETNSSLQRCFVGACLSSFLCGMLREGWCRLSIYPELEAGVLWRSLKIQLLSFNAESD